MKLTEFIDICVNEDVQLTHGDSVMLERAGNAIQQQMAQMAKVKKTDDSKELQLFSTTMLMKARKAFGIKNLGFFYFYQAVRRMELGLEEIPDDLFDQYRAMVRLFIRSPFPADNRKLSPGVLNTLVESTTSGNIRRSMLRISSDKDQTAKQHWRELAQDYSALVVMIARDKGVYMGERPLGGAIYWSRFVKLRPNQEDVAKLQDENPEMYAAETRYRKTIKEIDKNIKDKIISSENELKTAFIMNRPVNMSVNPITGEELVYDLDGEIIPVEDWKAKVQEQRAAKARMTEANEVKFEDARRADEEAVDSAAAIAKEANGQLDRMAITDDNAKADGLTRIYPVVDVPDPESEDPTRMMKVVASGRFKGISIDDLINDNGRMMEGTSWTYEKERGAQRGRPVRREVEEVEPYITMNKETPPRLMISVPGGSWATELRQKLNGGKHTPTKDALKSLISPPGLEKMTMGRGVLRFAFTVENFAVIQDLMGSVSLSEAAKDAVSDYYEELTRAELATKEENLRFYAPEQLSSEYIGDDGSIVESGFVARKGGSKLRFNSAQQKSLAWLEANGDSGVIALDTGVGKTAVAVAAAQKLVRDGAADDPDTNGRFLVVSPKNLRGNFTKECRGFLQKEARDSMVDRTDEISYYQLNVLLGKGGDSKVVNAYNKDWGPLSDYVAVIFDEAHMFLTDYKSTTARRILAFKHPRKIVLTASPMESEPMDAYMLAAFVANRNPSQGLVINYGKKRRPWTEEEKAEGDLERKRMRQFKNRFVERVGGRAVGIKNDPVTRKDLSTWVKRNIFFEDKSDVRYPSEDGGYETLPPLQKVALGVQMAPEVEEEYKKSIRGVTKVMRQMVKQFRDSKGSTDSRKKTEVEKEIFQFTTSRMKEEFKKLHLLANDPQRYAKEFNVPSLVNAENPKLETAIDAIGKKIARRGAKTILWTDDAKLAVMYAKELSRKLPGLHAAGTATQVMIFEGGSEVKSYRLKRQEFTYEHSLPFQEGVYKLNMDQPSTAPGNVSYRKAEWAKFAMKEVVNADPRIFTATLIGGAKGYSTGQNLQSFGSVMHIDRDTWNSEDMKQRTARAWRQGQKKAVDEITLDVRYSEYKSDIDRTLDEIKRYQQEMEAGLFNDIIKSSQEGVLGQEWNDTQKRHSSFKEVNQKTASLMLSPYLGQEEPE